MNNIFRHTVITLLLLGAAYFQAGCSQFKSAFTHYSVEDGLSEGVVSDNAPGPGRTYVVRNLRWASSF
jgi:hypothetical protein